ncbi:MAG: hypothetical protein FWC43_00275 [Planctomycetaceae bacterium]|nr:hypothetical protein [Planctomycetaceae bacterium]
MSLDAYSHCPGGRDKKVRFCCPDKLKELQQIQTMMEGGQNAACLALIEQLEAEKPPCACLDAAKLSLLRIQERWEEALELAERFYKREPENSLAASELAMAYVFCDRWKDAISTVIDGIERLEESTVQSALLTALHVVGEKALADGNVIPALSIARQLQLFQLTAEQGQHLYQRGLRTELPLVAKDMTFNRDCPADFPERQQFLTAANYVVSARWKKGLAGLESLIPHAEIWPELWKNIALLRLCLGEIDSAADALSHYTRYEKCSLEDAADAELLRLCMIADPLGDSIDIQYLVCKVSDAEKVQETLLSDKRFRAVDFNPGEFAASDTPPPRMMFSMLDHPFIPPDEKVTAENITSLLADMVLYGKETDRDARLEFIEVRSPDKDRITATIQEVLGQWILGWEEPEVVHTFSSTFLQLQPQFLADLKRDDSREEQRSSLQTIFEEKFIAHFLNKPLGLLDGKSPVQAVSDPAYTVRILGAILVIDFWLTDSPAQSLCNTLRERLNLPTPGPIPVPEELSYAANPTPPLGIGDEQLLAPSFLDKQPVCRWYRVDAKSLPTPALLRGFYDSILFQDARTMMSFAEAIMGRPLKEMPYFFRKEATRQMILKAQTQLDREAALSLIERGMIEAEETKNSDAWLNILEIPFRLGQGDFVKAQELIAHVGQFHRREQEAMLLLQNLMVSLGFLNPDGTPVSRAAYTEELPDEPPPAPSKLWVPD